MPSNPVLTCDGLIGLLEKQRCAFTAELQPLLVEQKAKLQKFTNLLSKDVANLNEKQRKAYSISTNIKTCIAYEVYLLCAFGTTPSGLGSSRLGDSYIGTISEWWNGVQHPKGLEALAARELNICIAPVQVKRRSDDIIGLYDLSSLLPSL